MTSLILLLFLQPQDVGTPLTETLVQAAEQALGPGSSVFVRSVSSSQPSDAAELQAARAAQAFAVARVAWQPARAAASSSSSPPARSPGPAACCAEARISITVVSTGRRAAQSLSFSASDALPERARAVGLVLGALTEPERASGIAKTSTTAVRNDAGASAPPSPPSPEAARSERTESPLPGGKTAGSPLRSEGAALIVAPAPVTASSAMRWALDAVGEQGIAVSGAGTGVGGAIGVRWMLSPRLALRAGVRGRFGDVGAAQASSRALAASGGAVLTLLPPRSAWGTGSERPAGAGSRFGLALRADALLLDESLSHLSADDTSPVRNGRWLPAGALFAEASWSLTPAAALLLDVGPELAFGRTTVFVHDSAVATLAPLRLVIQAGLLARF